MQYVVKHTYIATANNPHTEEGTTQVWYIGKGRYHDQDLKFVKGWKRKAFAENYIKNDKEWYENHPSDAWENEWSIVTIA